MFKVHYSIFGLYRLQFFHIDAFLFKLTILIQWQTCHTKTCQCTIHFAENYSVTQKVIHLTLQASCHLLSSQQKNFTSCERWQFGSHFTNDQSGQVHGWVHHFWSNMGGFL